MLQQFVCLLDFYPNVILKAEDINIIHSFRFLFTTVRLIDPRQNN